MWRTIGTFYLDKSWQYSNPVQGEIFRVRSSYIDNFNNQYLKGVVASIFVDDDSIINLVESRRLSYRLEPDIFTFYFPPGLGDQRIGVKRLDDTTLNWAINVDVFQSANPVDDFENYLISRFGNSLGEIMSVYNRGVAFVPHTPASARVELNSREKKKILDANSKRRNLTLTNGSSLILVCDGFQENGAPKTVLYTLQPNEEYNFPVNNGLYQGEIHFMNLTDSKANASYIEYNAAV